MNFVPNSQFQGAAAPFVLPVAYQNMSSNNSTFIPCPSVNFSDPRFGAYSGFGMVSNGFVHPQMQASLSGYDGHDPQTNPLMYMQAMQAMNSHYNTMRTSTTVNSNTNTAPQITEHSSQTLPVGRCLQSHRLTQAMKREMRMRELERLGRDLVSQVQTRCKRSRPGGRAVCSAIRSSIRRMRNGNV